MNKDIIQEADELIGELNEVTTIRETSIKQYEVMKNNTYLHPDEKSVLRDHVTMLREYVCDDDIETTDNLLFKKALEILNRITL